MNGGFRLNGLVCLFSVVLRHTIGQLVLYRCKFIRTSVSWTKVVSLAYYQSQRKEVRVLYVNIG